MSKMNISKSEPFFIAEIGHNHQGDVKKAMDLIKMSKEAGADAVKFQKRSNKNYILKSFIILSMTTKIVMEKHMENIEKP